MALLEVDNVVRTFGGIRAIDGVTFSVDDGETLGIIGPNGAGKTVLLNLISALYRVERGSIRFDGRPIDRMSAHRLAALGIARTFQSTEQFKDFKVIEYVMLGRFYRQKKSTLACALGLPGVVRSERHERTLALDALERLGLRGTHNEAMRELAYGIQKQVDIARAMVAQPRLMLLDEPTSGTTSYERDAIARALEAVKTSQTTLVIVDHDVRFLSSQCPRLLALNYGQTIVDGTPETVLSHPRVLESYLGSAASDAAPVE
jgi:branched-chain amino acid transport system ATP-binding protein